MRRAALLTVELGGRTARAGHGAGVVRTGGQGRVLPDVHPHGRLLVEVGDPGGPGQTLCILEAMKLMNEVKAEAEAIVAAIHVQNAQAVEFGQLLFELEPMNGRPLDAL